MSYRVEPFDDHDFNAFDCGKDELDDWVVRNARTASGQGTRTYVLVDGHGSAVGYFAIAPHLLGRDDAPRRISKGAVRQIPAILLAKLALDRSLHGQGLGAGLLLYALETIVEAARVAGGRLVIVDAIDDDAKRFYEHHDFEPLPNNPRRLVLKLSTAAKALDLDWP